MPVAPAVTIDLHSHVLPGIDDGPRELVDALAMAVVAARTGTDVLAATPHVRDDYPAVRPLEIPGRVAALTEALEERSIPLRVIPGGEVALADALERPVEELRAVTLGGNGTDLLVETPHVPLPGAFAELLGEIRRRGFRVLLAHPELNPDLQRRPGLAEELAGTDGVLLQVTASSLTPGKAAHRRLARTMLREGWIGCVATDAHRAGWRPPDLGGLIATAAEAEPAHAQELQWLVSAAPAAILAGAPLPPRPPRDPDAARGGLLGRWRRR